MQKTGTSMCTYRVSSLLILLFVFCGRAGGQMADPPLKVLFIGNSYTYVNDLPAIVVGLAKAAGGRQIETDGHLVGGCTLERHVKDEKALGKIRDRKWDVVVLQEHSLQPIINRDSLFRHARILDNQIKRQGAKTIFYLTWARQRIPEMQGGAAPSKSPRYARAMYEMSGAANAVDFETWCRREEHGLTGGLNGAYCEIAKELDAQVAPVGMAWKMALAADPRIVLHQADGSHPNPEGSYLAACVFYATLLGKSPVGLPGELRKGGTLLVQIPPEEAKRLQEVAWKAVVEMKGRSEAKAGRCRDAAKRGRLYLAGLFDPSTGLLPEFRGSKTYWLYHDNYLAAKVLRPSHPELAERIANSIQGYGIRESGKIEIVFGEAKRPLPFRHYRLSDVRHFDSKVVKTEVVSDPIMVGWEQYADLLLLASMALAPCEPLKAKEHFRNAAAMWDGKGLRDRVVEHDNRYATYKLALVLIAARRLGVHPSTQDAVLERLLAQQERDGGWITDYDSEGKPVGVANVETTSLAVLALDSLSE